jgi:hypothetical protein
LFCPGVLRWSCIVYDVMSRGSDGHCWTCVPDRTYCHTGWSARLIRITPLRWDSRGGTRPDARVPGLEMPWSPGTARAPGKSQRVRKGLLQRVKNHYQRRVVLIETVFWKCRQKSGLACRATETLCFQTRMHRQNAS